MYRSKESLIQSDNYEQPQAIGRLFQHCYKRQSEHLFRVEYQQNVQTLCV